MPTYTINGKKIKTDKPLSEADIEEIAASLGGVSRQTKGGADEVPGAVGPDGKSYYDTLKVERPNIIPESAWNSFSDEEKARFAKDIGKQNTNADRQGRAISNALAGAAAVPVLAAGARGLQALTRGSKAAPYTADLGKVLIPNSGTNLIREGLIGAGAGITAGEAGDYAAERFGEGSRGTGEFLGGMAGGWMGNAALSGPKLAFDAVKSGYNAVKEKLFGNELSNALGTSAGRTQIERALTANPNFAKDLAGAEQIQQRLGINLPMPAAAKDDPSVKSMMAKVTSRGENDTFVAEMVTAENTAKEQLKAARDRLATNPKDASLIAEYNAAKDNAAQAAERALVATKQAKREKVITDIDDRIAELSDNMMKAGEGKANVGQRISSLVSAREKAVKAEFDPQYVKAIEDGKAAGEVMPSENLKAIDDWINQEGRKDIFGTMPKLMGVVNRVLAGKKNAQMDDTFANFPIEGREVVTPKNSYVLNPEEADSLKKAVNKALRDTKDDKERRLLIELKDRVNAGLDNMGTFGARLKEIDGQYRAKVGEPFLDANGVVAVNDANFVERTIPLLTTTPTALADIKAAVGNTPEFKNIVRDAWLWKLGSDRTIVKDGNINVPALNRFLRDNKETIGQIDGLEGELRAIGSRVDALKSTRERIQARVRESGIKAFEDKAKQNPTLWQEINSTNGGLIGYVDSALRTPEKMSKLIQQAGTSQEAHSALRSAALEAALTKSDKLKYFDEHTEAFNSLFGKGYTEDVKLLLDAAQRLQSYPFMFKPSPTLTAGTGFQQATGMPIAQASNTLANPIGGKFWAASRFLSKFTQNKAQKAEQDEIMAFLRNRKAVGDAAEAMKAAEDELKATGKLGVKAAKYAAKMASNAATAGIFGGVAGYGLGQADILQEAPKRQYVDPEMEMENLNFNQQDNGYGARPDGTMKGSGYLGELKLKGGGVATEYSVQSDAVKINGKRVDFPTLVPTLTPQEVKLMQEDIIPNDKEPPEAIMQKAIAYAKQRIAQGKSPFKE